jgi:MFS family permease
MAMIQELDNIDDSVVPGTVHLVDIEQVLHTKHAKGSHQDIVLVPSPSSDPDDPLNWSLRRKALSSACWIVYTLVNGIANSVVYSVLVPLSESLHITTGDLNAGTGYLFLLAGYGLLFWQPVALQYGKRPVYLLSTLGILGMTIWSPYTNGNGQWIAKNILGGFFAAPIEALPELSVTDVYFAHERGTYLALYAFALVGSNYLAPVICGFINDGQGYKWVFYWPTIFCAVGFIFMFFFMEETNYDRKSVGVVEGTSSPSDYEKGATEDIVVTSKKTFVQKLSPKDKPRQQLIHHRILLQLRFVAWPNVFYAGFAYGSTLIWFNVLNATASIIFSAPPYNFSAAIVGVTYVACLIGVALGFFFCGRISDWLAVKLARRNGGIYEPEQRLWLFAASSVIIPFALILWGVGAAREIHWFGLTFAMAVLAFVNTCGCTLSVNYLVDCFKDMSGDGLTSVILIRNTMSFAIGYGITPWLTNLGTQNCFISAAFVGLAASLAFLPMVKWGKYFREQKRVAYWGLVRQAIEKGAIH